MDVADQFGKVADGHMLPLRRKGMLEGHVDQAVEILDIENDGIPSGFPPAANQIQALVTSRHVAGEIDPASLEILGDGNRMLNEQVRRKCRESSIGCRA